MMHKRPDVSILLPTHDRAETLRGTLESMTRLRCDGMDLRVVVIANGCTDHTDEVAAAFEDRLPLQYLREAAAGKSAALNRALDECEIGEIVVFVDDDVFVRDDWLERVVASCERWPDYRVFGGKIELVWPSGSVPGWARNGEVQYWAFGLHDQGPTDRAYPYKNYPGGANYWVRRGALEHGTRFDTAVGPRPTRYKVMGTETSFLHELALAGEGIMYVADAIVDHVVQPHLLQVPNIKSRAFRWGKGMPHRGLCHPQLFARSPLAWRLLRLSSLARHLLRYGTSLVDPRYDRRIARQLQILTCLGYDLESLRLASAVDSLQPNEARRTGS